MTETKTQAKRVPNTFPERVDDCGCQLKRTPHGLTMKDCPLHATALELRDACINAQAVLGDRVRDGSASNAEKETYQVIKQALSKIDGGLRNKEAA